MQNDQLSPLLEPISWENISGWKDDDHLAAFRCFQQSAKRIAIRPYSKKKLSIPADAFVDIANIALDKIVDSSRDARSFFERYFSPFKFIAKQQTGKLTGYFEPMLEASPVRTPEFSFPLYKRPNDLIDLDDANRPAQMDENYMFGRKSGADTDEYFDRQQINNGALEGQGLELFWLHDPVDVFFIHIQGSARLLMPDGSTKNVSYAAKSGHPYTPIGKTLVEMGEMKLSDVTMRSIRKWLAENPARQFELMENNCSYIFFRQTNQPDSKLGPIAAAGVPLTAGRSIAIDHKLHTFATPIWVETRDPYVEPENRFSRLLVAQDTGSAIVGEQRGDLFVGTGNEAGRIAGKLNHAVSMIVLVPNAAHIA